MKHILLTLLIAASVSGCATAPNQGFLGGLRHGGLALAGAMSEDVFAEQSGHQPTRRMKPQQTDCRPDYIGGFTCVTREQ